ncbi:carbohydrate ABC transporter ATP-binding protein CUT1 family [Coprobacillus sp. CAG:826]|nr:carbohydrate ABC transporter ATP-binding protein CUT1 family [Coprobacillus sp. CAG:826]
MIKGILFDLDGVLLSTDHFHYLAWKAIADEEGIEFNEKINQRLRGVSRMASLDIVLEKAHRSYTLEEKEALAEKKNNIYKKYLESLNKDSIDPKVIETLKKLQEQGIHLAIGSSSKNTRYILEKTELLSYFEAVVDGTMISHSKPHPEVFLKARDALKLTSSECLVVEDAMSGIDAGVEGGFETCGLLGASRYKKTTYPLKSLQDILMVVEVKNSETLKEAEHRIELKHIKKVYPNGVTAVKDFSLTIEDNEFVVFVGPSGCGKSTVLRMIAGLEEISDGELLIDGQVMNDTEPIQRNISMVFQNYALYPHLTVRDNIVFPLAIQRVPLNKFFDFTYRKERKERIRRIGEQVAAKIGLTEYLDRKPKNLSGGQRQRVALGRALIRHPIAFLLDEPLSNLDAKMRAQMRTEISKLHNELKKTFIYVTHDQVEAMTMGSKIVVMKDGYIQQIATPNELFLHPINKFVAGFIGTPQMNFFKVKLVESENQLYAELQNKKKLLIPEEIRTTIKPEYIGKEVTMGIRPKAIRPSKESNELIGTLVLFEQLGDEALLYFKMEGVQGEFVASVETYNSYRVKEEIGFTFDLTHVCFFDLETEGTIHQW